MMGALTVDRIHFAFTATFHYLFPQLTMGLALLIVVLKTLAIRTGDAHYDEAARFWGRIFGINFVVGVVTGIPMEFQFGTNWSVFSKSTGAVIGQTLAMEGVFSFFLESTFLGAFLFGEKRLGPRLHWLAAFLVFLGSWISGFFIIATNAWMQPSGRIRDQPRRHFGVDQPRCFAHQPLGALAIPSQYDCHCSYRVGSDGGFGSVLSPDASVRGLRPHLRAPRCDRGLDSFSLDGISHGRWSGAKRFALSASHASRDGRPVR